MGEVVTDVRYTLRSLRRAPGFAAVVVVTLALGIGGNSAIFSLVNGVLLRPLPYQSPDELVAVWLEFRNAHGQGREIAASEPEFMEFRDQSAAFAEVAGYWTGRVNLGGTDEPQRVTSASVSANFFRALDVTLLHGRGFSDGEDRPGVEPVAILSHGLWQRAFGGDESILGRSVALNGRAFTVIGILPLDFRFPGETVDVVRPAIMDPQNLGGRSSHYVSMLARLRPGVTLEAARADVSVLVSRWNTDFPDRHGPSETHPIVSVGLRERMVGDVRPALLLLSGAVVLVLLIACANVANLTLARAEARHREVGIRTALGAGRGRLLRQLMTESAVVALLGGAAGLALAVGAVRALAAWAPSDLPRLHSVGIDGVVVLFTLGVSLLTAILFGIAPSVAASRSDVGRMIRGAATSGRERILFRRILVVSEVGLAVVLVVVSGLLIKSFARLQSVDPGFNPTGVVAMDFYLPAAVYADNADVAGFHVELADRLARLPGFIAAGAVRRLPLRGEAGMETLNLPGRVRTADDPTWNSQYQVTSPGFFEALAIPLVRGRLFTDRDNVGAPPVAIVNEALAQRLWPDLDAVGRSVQVGAFEGNTNPVMTVVGIVSDVRQAAMERVPGPQLFVPRGQAGAIYGGFVTRGATLAIRADAEPGIVMSAARQVVREIDPTLPVSNMQSMRSVVAQSVSDARFTSFLMGSFSVVALLLGAVGIYGLIGYDVARRTREIGLRMALGADQRGVLGLVVRQGMTLAGAGVVLGMVGALIVSGVVAGLVFDVSVHDPLIFASAPAILLGVSLVAAFLPARRAAAVDPMEAIRVD